MPVLSPPIVEIGWTAKAISPDDWSTVLADVVRFMSVGMVDQISDPGSGSIEIDYNDPLWQDVLGKQVLSREVLWQIYQNGSLRGEFMSEDVTENVVAQGEAEAQSRLFTGRGPASVLEWAVVMPEGSQQDEGGSLGGVGHGLLPLMKGSGPEGGAAAGAGLAPAGSEQVDIQQSYGERVWAIAHAQLGKRYRFGAAGPDEYDCSGLTKYSWFHGTDGKVNLIHHAYTQFHSAHRVCTGSCFGSAQKGDLVFFAAGNQCPPSCPGHVAIAEGDRVHVISATSESTGVEYRNIIANPFSGGVMGIARPLSGGGDGGNGGGGGSGGGSGGVTRLSRGLLPLLSGVSHGFDSQGQGSRVFKGPIIRAFIALYNEAVARGTITWLNLDFDGDKDSSGKAWDDDQTTEVSIGTDLLSFWSQICTDNAFEWHMDPGFHLKVYKTTDSGGGSGEISYSSARGLLSFLRRYSHRRQYYQDEQDFGHHQIDSGFGLHKEDAVRFEIGRHQTSHDRTRTRRDLRNFIFIQFEDGVIFQSQDEKSEAFWARREQALDPGSIADGQSLQEFIDTALASAAEEKESRTVQVVPDGPGRTVFTDYGLADWIAVDTDRGGYEPLRVVALAVTVDQDGNTALELTLMSVIEAWEERVNAALGGGGSGGGTQPVSSERLLFGEEDLGSIFTSAPLPMWKATRILSAVAGFRTPPTGAGTVEILINGSNLVVIPLSSGDVTSNWPGTDPVSVPDGSLLQVRTGGSMSPGAAGLTVVLEIG